MNRPTYIYGDDSVHPIGTAEKLSNGRWRASTRSVLLGSTYRDEAEALEAIRSFLAEGAS